MYKRMWSFSLNGHFNQKAMLLADRLAVNISNCVDCWDYGDQNKNTNKKVEEEGKREEVTGKLSTTLSHTVD